MSHENDKRSRLVAAADKLFHEQGVNTTTLANIAQLADVPLGNVYYYFKSKDSIVIAVIEFRRVILEQQFKELNVITDSKERLEALIKQVIINNREYTASFGDALGSLCQELGKQGGAIAEAAAKLMQETLDWCERQFATLGKGDRAQSLALNLVSALQGTNLLTLTFKDPKFAEKQADFLIDWIDRA